MSTKPTLAQLEARLDRAHTRYLELYDKACIEAQKLTIDRTRKAKADYLEARDALAAAKATTNPQFKEPQ